VLLDFDLAWSGAANGNSAVATGSLTIDTALLPEPTTPDAAAIVDFSITVSGAATGNGTFTFSDFSAFIFDAGLSPAGVDFGVELVGQVVASGPLFIPGVFTSDFNFFKSNPLAPEAVVVNTIVAGGTDLLDLTSFAPAAIKLPAPGALVLFCLGLVGLNVIRRRWVA
jgi:hypothetical protein